MTAEVGTKRRMEAGEDATQGGAHGRGRSDADVSRDGPQRVIRKGGKAPKKWQLSVRTIKQFAAARVFHDNARRLNGLDWSCDGCSLVTSADDDTSHLYNAHTAECEKTLYSKRHGVDRMIFDAYSTNVTIMASAKRPNDYDTKPAGDQGSYPSLRVWDILDNKYLKSLPVKCERWRWCRHLSLHAENKLVIAACTDGQPRVFNLQEDRCVTEPVFYGRTLLGPSLPPPPKPQGPGGHVTFWSEALMNMVRPAVIGGTSQPNLTETGAMPYGCPRTISAEFDPKGNVAGVSFGDGCLHLYDIRKSFPPGRVSASISSGLCMSFDLRDYFRGREGSPLKEEQWNAQRGSRMTTADITHIRFHPSRHELLISTSGHEVISLCVDGGGDDFKARSFPFTLDPCVYPDDFSVGQPCYSPDGRFVCAGGCDGRVHIWTSEGVAVTRLKGHAGLPRFVKFNPKMLTLVSGDVDVAFWSANFNGSPAHC